MQVNSSVRGPLCDRDHSIRPTRATPPTRRFLLLLGGRFYIPPSLAFMRDPWRGGLPLCAASQEGLGAGFETAQGKVSWPGLASLALFRDARRQDGSGVSKAGRGQLDGFLVALAKGRGGRLSDARRIEHRFHGRFRLSRSAEIAGQRSHRDMRPAEIGLRIRRQ